MIQHSPGDQPIACLVLAGACADLQGVVTRTRFQRADCYTNRAGSQTVKPFGLLGLIAKVANMGGQRATLAGG